MPQDRTHIGSAPRPSGAGSAGGAGGRGGRNWRPFRFINLEKVSLAHVRLLERLQWVMPGLQAGEQVSPTLRQQLKALLEEDVSLSLDYVHVVAPAQLKSYVGEPTFLAVVAPKPHKTRGFLEVELGLAHAVLDTLLGGAGEAVALRALTDLEEGVMTYVILEALKALSPAIDPALPKLKLEGVCHGLAEAQALLGTESLLAVVQLKAVFGQHSGSVRLFIPGTALGLANPPADAAVRRARRFADAKAHLSRLSAVKTWLRAEIGSVEIARADLMQIRERDVVLVDELTTLPHKGEPGTARLKVGAGRTGHFDADLTLEGNRYIATITGCALGEEELPAQEPLDDPDPYDEGQPPADAGVADAPGAGGPEESTNPGFSPKDAQSNDEPAQENHVDETLQGAEGSELLNDIPLQLAVELSRIPVSAEDVVGLKVGQVIDMNRMAGEPVDLSVNGKVVARGELVEVDGNLGVRVLSLAG